LAHYVTFSRRAIVNKPPLDYGVLPALKATMLRYTQTPAPISNNGRSRELAHRLCSVKPLSPTPHGPRIVCPPVRLSAIKTIAALDQLPLELVPNRRRANSRERQSAKRPFRRATVLLYREAHVLVDDLAEAVVDGTRKEFMETLTTVPSAAVRD
jgi:hypothetical protein